MKAVAIGAAGTIIVIIVVVFASRYFGMILGGLYGQ